MMTERKWKLNELKEGRLYETTFWVNPLSDSKFRFRATHLDGHRAPKVVLCNDPRVRPGVPCRVRLVTIHKPERNDRRSIEVEFERLLDFKLVGVYLDPIVSKKLQVLLESGLNILLDGPQGCGKTVTARSIAQSLGMEFVFFNCGAVIDATDFFATIQVRASETGQPVTEFTKTEILTAFESAADHPKCQYLVFLDELNRCHESARNSLMPALDSTRKVFHPIENRFIQITDNVQFIAAVNRGNEFTATFGIDAAQLDRFAPLQMNYPPLAAEVELLRTRHPELNRRIVTRIVDAANRIRNSAEIGGGLSVRATEEVCVYLKHPLFEDDQDRHLMDVFKSSFCGRFTGRWDDISSDAGAVWSVLQGIEREEKRKKD
jgi:nitric oxide reductase NorQ protein